MSPEKLVHMANQIADFFALRPPASAAEGIAGHINDFWDPRMRAGLLAIVADGGRGLSPLVVMAAPMIRPAQAA